MKISVVIPAYNEEKLLPRTLASLKRQTRPPDEIIVLNASSTDATEEVSRRAGADVVTLPKRTIGYSRQQGILRATGDIVLQTDADAQLPDDWIGRMLVRLENKKYLGYFGGFRVVDGPLWYRLYINYFQPVSNTILFAVLKLPFATGQNMGFWRDEAIAAGGIPEDYKLAEDIEIARRLQKRGKIYFTQSEYVLASGRRGYERGMFFRISQAFFYYFIFRKANKIGFPAIR